MKTPAYSIALGTLGLLGALFLSGCGQGYNAEIVHVGDGVLTFRDADGQSKSLPVALDAQVTLDGAPVMLDKLVPGDRVNVKVEKQDGSEIATRVEARSAESEAQEPQGPVNPESGGQDPKGPEKGLEPIPRS